MPWVGFEENPSLLSLQEEVRWLSQLKLTVRAAALPAGEATGGRFHLQCVLCMRPVPTWSSPHPCVVIVLSARAANLARAPLCPLAEDAARGPSDLPGSQTLAEQGPKPSSPETAGLKGNGGSPVKMAPWT